MIRLVVHMRVSADKLDKYLELAKEVTAETNAKDSGCIQYELFRDTQDPLHFVMLEEWENQAALDAHLKAPHFTGLVPKMDGLTAKPPTLTLLEKVF